ncbi:hypothetical protein G20c_63 [Thermus phage G20c]|nr:hypothetical protein G20c_63 [Thermus phage G20c]
MGKLVKLVQTVSDAAKGFKRGLFTRRPFIKGSRAFFKGYMLGRRLRFTYYRLKSKLDARKLEADVEA